MNTSQMPQMVPQRGLGPLIHASRDGPHRRRDLAILAVTGVVTVILAIVVITRIIASRQTTTPANPANPANPALPIPTSLTVPTLAATYGDQALALTATVGGGDAIVGAGTVTFTILSGDQAIAAPIVVPVSAGAATVTAPLPANLAAGTYTVRVTYGGGTGFDGSSSTTSLTVAKRLTAVTFAPLALMQTYDGTAKVVLPQTDPANLPLTLTYSRDGVPVAAPVGAGTYQVTATIADPNYQGTSSGTLVIERALPTVTWQPPASIVYGTPLSAAQLNATAALGNAFAYSPPLGTILPAGSAQTLTATFIPPDTENYRPVTVQMPLTVTPATLSVVANHVDRVYGAANPPLTAVLQGFVNGETEAVLEGTPQFTTTATPSSPVGTYPIAVTQGELHAANYTFSFVPGTLTVTKASLTVAASNATRVYGAPEPTFTGTLTGVVNADPIAVAYLTDAAVTSPVGEYPIAPLLADPAGRLGNYQVTGTSGTLKIVPAQTTATALEVLVDEGQAVTLRAQVTQVAPSIVTVDEGQAVFTIRQDTTDLLTTAPVAIKGGVATVTLPSDALDAGTYNVAVAFSGGTNFTASAGNGALVIANVAPTATLLGPGEAVLEGSTFTIALTDPFDTSAKDLAAGFTYAFDLGDGQGYGPATTSNKVTITARDDPGQVIHARITDRQGGTTTYTLRVPVLNVAPTVRISSGPTFAILPGEFVTMQATFTDPGLFDRHSAVWAWGDGVTTPVAVATTDGNASVLGHHLYEQPGVYAVTLTVTDDSTGTGQATYGFVVVLDRRGGVGFGTGTFAAPTGTAALGFVAGFPTSLNAPVATQFQFRLGDRHFVATDPAQVTANDALLTLEGTGALNGIGEYRYRLVVSDGQWPGGDGFDRVRLALWDPTGALVYDSQPGAAPDAAPTTIVTGDIAVHQLQIVPITPAATSGDGYFGLTER